MTRTGSEVKASGVVTYYWVIRERDHYVSEFHGRTIRRLDAVEMVGTAEYTTNRREEAHRFDNEPLAREWARALNKNPDNLDEGARYEVVRVRVKHVPGRASRIEAAARELASELPVCNQVRCYRRAVRSPEDEPEYMYCLEHGAADEWLLLPWVYAAEKLEKDLGESIPSAWAPKRAAVVG